MCQWHSEPIGVDDMHISTVLKGQFSEKISEAVDRIAFLIMLLLEERALQALQTGQVQRSRITGAKVQ